MAGWDYPKHLAGRAYGLIVHGDVAGVEGARRALSDWLDWMGFIDAGAQARLDRYIGYYEPYATSHEALDKDENVQEETRNVARAVAKAVVELRAGRLRRCSRSCRVRGPSRESAMRRCSRTLILLHDRLGDFRLRRDGHAAGLGRHRPPRLPAPQQTLIPTVNIAPAKGWPPARRRGGAGTRVAAFASGLDHPRWLYVLPNGDVLVAETNAPPKPDDAQGIKGWVMGLVMNARAPACPAPTASRCCATADGDGVADLAQRLPRGPELAVRHGAGRQRPLRRQHRRGAALSLRARRNAASPPRAARWSTCRPARSTTTGPRT